MITLGIIGIVAAMLIPNLISDIKKRDTAAKLEKMYSTISQATQNSELENGFMQTWESPTTDWDAAKSKAWWNKYFIPYANLAIVKQCDDTNKWECWSIKATFLDGQKFYDGSAIINPLMLKDGTTINFTSVSSSTAQIYVDLNGLKGPNVVGKDIFYMAIAYKAGKNFLGLGDRNTILTGGNYCCNKATGDEKGIWCGRLIQLDGWQIKDDYPW